jgi:hypothetical protein
MRCSSTSSALVSCVLHSRLHEKMMRMLCLRLVLLLLFLLLLQNRIKATTMAIDSWREQLDFKFPRVREMLLLLLLGGTLRLSDIIPCLFLSQIVRDFVHLRALRVRRSGG